MIAIGVRYLTKYAAATDEGRQRPEWPPHFGRVFMAMAAAHFETGADPKERAALEWIEAVPPPSLRVSEAFERSLVRAYVPANDAASGVDRRTRQERGFPRVRPHDDSVYYIWESPAAREIREALDRVCGSVTRVGHSSSAVQMWVVPEGAEPAPTLVPGTGVAERRMRVTGRGTLESLERAFNGSAMVRFDELAAAAAGAKGKERARIKGEMEEQFPAGRPTLTRPRLVQWQGYSRAKAVEEEAAAIDGPFDDEFVVLSKLEGPNLGLASTLRLTGALRNSAMAAAGGGAPEWMSGHDPSGAPSVHPHLAFFPLPYVGSEHSDGHIMGLGIAIPRELPPESFPDGEELRRYLGPLFFEPESGAEKRVCLWEKREWRWQLEIEKRERPPMTLRRTSWTGPSRVWASVTPVVLHHYPKRRDGDVERIVREAFASALLPEPESVVIRPVSPVTGVGHVKEVPLFSEGGESLCRYQTHVVVRFPAWVRGPLLAGRGRFRGYGLFRPMAESEGGPWRS